MSVHKIETVRDSEHRLFALAGEGQGVELAVGRAKSLAEGVTLTLADQAGNAMVEIVDGKRGSAQVTVDGAEVFEIAHCKPGQKIEVGGEAFVVLAPFGIFVQARKREAEDTPAPTPMPVRTAVRARKAPPKAKKSPLLLVVAAMVCVAGVGLAMMPGAEEPAPEPAKRVVVAKPAPKRKLVQAPPPAPVPVAIPEPTPEPVVVKVETPAPAPVPTPDKRPKAPKVKTAAAPEKPAAQTSLPPEREAAVRKQIESYQLEAGFDPDAAAMKLRKLKAELPADAAIRGEVDNALKGLPQ